MENAELIRVRDMLTKIVNYLDKHIDNVDGKCLHESNVLNLTTMGSGPNKYKCIDCGEVWEEAFEENSENDFIIGTLGGSPSSPK